MVITFHEINSMKCTIALVTSIQCKKACFTGYPDFEVHLKKLLLSPYLFKIRKNIKFYWDRLRISENISKCHKHGLSHIHKTGLFVNGSALNFQLIKNTFGVVAVNCFSHASLSEGTVTFRNWRKEISMVCRSTP